MEVLLIINSILLIICLYFVKDFHKEFKLVSRKVEQLKKKVSKLSMKFGMHSKSVEDKFNRMDNNKNA